MNQEEHQNYVMYTRLFNGAWTEPVELKLVMDAGQPCVSYDGKYLYFTSGDPIQRSDIDWISSKIIEELRLKE